MMPEKPPVSSTMATLFTWSPKHNGQKKDGKQQRRKHNGQNTENKKSIDHLLKALVDNTGASHISKACSSSVAVTALCLSSEGKCKIEDEKKYFFAIYSKIVDKSQGAVIALPLPLKVRWGAQGTLTIH